MSGEGGLQADQTTQADHKRHQAFSNLRTDNEWMRSASGRARQIHPPSSASPGRPGLSVASSAEVSSRLRISAFVARLHSSVPYAQATCFMTLNKPNDLEAGSTHGHSDAGKRGTPDIRVDPGTPLDRSTEARERPTSGQSHRYMSGLIPPSESGARRLRQPASAAVADSETSSEKPATSRHVPDGENAVSLRRKPSIAFTATSGVAPQTFRDLAVLYQVVAEVGRWPLIASQARSLTSEGRHSVAQALTTFFGNVHRWL